MSPRGRIYLTTFGKVAFARPIAAKFGQFRCLPLHPAVPEARFRFVFKVAPKMRIAIVRQTTLHRKPSLGLMPSANQDRAKPIAQGVPKRDRGREPPTKNWRARARCAPWPRRCLGPAEPRNPTYGCCFGCPVLLFDAW
jgi:hypothetical protein